MPKPRSLDGDPVKEEIAARLVATAQGHLKVPEAMRIVKIATPIRENDSIRRRVFRRAKKLEAEAKNNAGIVMPPVQVVEASEPESLDTGGLSSVTGNSASTPEDLDEIRRALSGSSASITSSEKQRRKTSKQMQSINAKAVRNKKLQSLGMKTATKRVHQNKFLSPTKRKSQRQIVEEVNKAVGSNLNPKTVSRMVLDGNIGVSPLKRGPVGNFSKKVWEALKNSYVTFIKLEGSKCKSQSSMSDLSKRVNGVINHGGWFQKKGLEVVRKLRKETADQVDVGSKNVVEQRRVLWTTHNNLNIWYDSWEQTLIDLEFARLKTVDDPEDIEGSLYFYPGQTNRILNFDETDGSLDNTNGVRGGRPAIVFTATDGAKSGATQASKSSYSPTIICGSTAAGKALPPHFQLKSMAQTSSGQRFSVQFIGNCKCIKGKFGFPVEKTLDCTFGMNEKAGMNSEELHKYLLKAILPLFPDVQDFPRKRVICKVDSGPGRMNPAMLAELKLRGFYLFPGVPNTTSVTQETDQNYGPFKIRYRKNLELLSQERFLENKTIQINDLPLIVFGREATAEKEELCDAFAQSFSRELCLSAWKRCGSVPLTRAALKSDKVRHEVMLDEHGNVDDACDPETRTLLRLEEVNHLSCDLLTSYGFDGSKLRIDAPRRKKLQQLTQPFSLERQEAIRQATTAGQLFHATGGTMLNSEDMFRAKALSQRQLEKESLLAKFKSSQKRSKIRLDALEILQKKGRGDLTLDNHKQFTAVEVKTLLQWKLGKTAGKKADLIQRYVDTPRPPKEQNMFGHANGRRLQELQKNTIPLRETALGVAAKQNANAVINNLSELDNSDEERLFQALSKKRTANLKDDRDYTDGHDEPPQPI